MNLIISRSIPIDKTFICMSFYTLYKRSIAFDARKLKVSKANGMKTCWFLETHFLMFATLLEADLRVVCSLVKPLVLSHTSEKTLVKYTHACFPHTHSYTRTFIGLSVSSPSHGSVKKFTYTFFFTNTPDTPKYIK